MDAREKLALRCHHVPAVTWTGWALTFPTKITTGLKLKSSCDGTRDRGASARLCHPCSVVVLWCERSALTWSVVWWWELSARTICGVLVVTLVPRLLWMRFTSLIGRFCNHCQKEGGGCGAGCRFFCSVLRMLRQSSSTLRSTFLFSLTRVFAA